MTSAGSFTIASITSGGRSVGPVTFDTGTGLTQFADPSGQVQPEVVSQDGYGAGSLTSLSVTPDGRVVGAFTNGQTVALAQITVAQFAADDALERRDGGAFAQTVGSGQPIYTLDGASISSGALEASNTDIAAEFSKMIVSQQAYNANTRVISTAQQMMQELMNVVR
jgi:flagellar hook protein FlgE